MNLNYDVVIVGGGIVGFSTAWQLLKKDKHLKVAVIEKESHPGMHQTGHNSGVIHAGVYYKPGSMKAKYCYAGCHAIKQFCHEHEIPYQELGKLIVALNTKETEWMQALADRSRQNGLTVEMLSGAAVQKMQPGLQAEAGFYVKESGIIHWRRVCNKYAELFQQLGGEIYFNQKVVAIRENNKTVTIKTSNGQKYETQFLITCSGLHSDRLVRMSGLKTPYKIIPFRGEYFKLSSKYSNYFRHLIYPVPNPDLPFLGVHFTPHVDGYTTVGPNAIMAFAREGYSWNKINLKDSFEILSYFPTWKMLARNRKATYDELRGSISKNYYVKQLQAYVPAIQKEDLQPYPAGVRAQAVDKEGKLIEDFLFIESDRILHSCNAPSPAATSSLPIGQHIVDTFYRKAYA